MPRGRRRNQDRSGARQYPRTARLNELCQEIIAEEVERIDDERLELVTITFVRVDRDMSRALVLFTSLGEAEDEAAEALASHRVRLQAAIGRQASMRRTPELRFEVDHVVETGNRIEQLLRDAPPVRSEHPELTDGRYRLVEPVDAAGGDGAVAPAGGASEVDDADQAGTAGGG